MAISGHESRAARLARFARKHKPIRAPFYVQHATAECRLIGWYWQPAGASKPEALGQNYESAAVALLTLDTEEVATP